MMMTTPDTPLTYPITKIGADYLRSAVGAGICLAPVLFGVPVAGGTWVLVGLAGIFVVFAVRTGLRQYMRVWVDEDGIAVSGLARRALRWNKLSEVTLSYYSTMRGKGKGWMQLRLRGEGHTVRLESSIDGFIEIARRAAEAARANGLAVNNATVRNYGALGIEF